MKLTCHGAMIESQSYLRPSQEAPCYQWRILCSDKWSCSLSQLRIKSNLKTVSCLAESNGEALVHRSFVHSPHSVYSREWLGRKVGQSRYGVSRAAEFTVVGNAKSQLGAAQEISYEELGRYGIDESDYIVVMTSPQRQQIPDEHEKSSSNANLKSKAENGFARKQKIDPEDTEDTQATESNDYALVDGHDWCTYLILSNDKRRTYMGVTAHLTRRYVLYFHLDRSIVVFGYEFHVYHLVGTWKYIIVDEFLDLRVTLCSLCCFKI